MSIYLKRALILLFVMLIVVSYLTVKLYRTSIKGAFSDAKLPTVVLDAGHGDPDGGAVSKDGTVESEINLEIAKKVRAILEEKCYNVIMTRETVEGIHKEGETIRAKKLSDMHERERIMNQSGAGLFVSIHLNSFSDPSVSGAQVFYSANDGESKVAGGFIQERLAQLNAKNDRLLKEASSAIYLMKKACIPAVLVECGFLSNPEEASRLTDEREQQKLAEAIASGIDWYMNGGNDTKDENENRVLLQ